MRTETNRLGSRHERNRQDRAEIFAVFEARLRSCIEKYRSEDATKKTTKRSSQIDGFFLADCLTSKEFYDRYKDEPSGWCPDFPAAVDSALRRLGMVPVIRGSKGKGNSNKWWHLMAKKLLIKAKRKKSANRHVNDS